MALSRQLVVVMYMGYLTRLTLGIGLTGGIAAIGYWMLSGHVNSTPLPNGFARSAEKRSSAGGTAPVSGTKPQPDQPEKIAKPSGEPDRIIHRDPLGNAPVEKINTPSGWVTIQRTFKADGSLLKEEAFQDGLPVPIPKR